MGRVGDGRVVVVHEALTGGANDPGAARRRTKNPSGPRQGQLFLSS